MLPSPKQIKIFRHLHDLFCVKDSQGRLLVSRWVSRLLICPSPSSTALAIRFVHKELVFCLAALAAAISVFFTKPSLSLYLSYIDLRVLELLFSLMATAAGLQRVGFFQNLAVHLRRHCRSKACLANLLVLLCFFSAMFITNDIALIVFVPFTLQVMRGTSKQRLIFTIVMETVAANLGSMVTPLGNPQNIFLCSFYNLGLKQFLTLTIPWSLVSLTLIEASMFIEAKFVTSSTMLSDSCENELPKLDRALLLRYFLCLALCLLTVAKVVSAHFCASFILIWLLAADRELLKHLDYVLLLTFVCFFIFVGNTAQVEQVKEWAEYLLAGRELFASALLSQIISNVPAAVMLAPFTKQSVALLLGVNLGGLGTLVASLASLISYRLYINGAQADSKAYLYTFTVLNFTFLAILLLLASCLL